MTASSFAGWVTAVLLAAAATPAAAQRVIDGDTIEMDGTRWRLWGIDAPETHQACADGWPAGLEAKRFLELFLSQGSVECAYRGRDRYGRSIGLCRTGGQDVGADMVWAGMAWAFTRYSSDYVDQEKAAIGAQRGVHAHDCKKAWDWRQRNR